MNTVTVSSTQLKNELADLLNQVVYKGVDVVVERYGKAIARLTANTDVKTEKKATNLKNKTIKEKLDYFYGIAPDFPSYEEIRKARYSGKHRFNAKNLKI